MSINVKKIIVPVVAVVLVIVLAAAVFFAVVGGIYLNAASKYKFTAMADYIASDSPPTRVHFLNTSGTDAIILESSGRYGMIDAAEDNDNPRNLPGLAIKGYEDVVIDYIKKNCLVDGVPRLEFIIGTHAHSDHLGGVDSIIMDSSITVETLYLKRYYADRINDHEVSKWDNQEVYDAAINAAKQRGVKIVQELVDLKITLGEYNITFYNGQEAEIGKKVGENENSLAILAESQGKRLLFAGDMNNIDGDESRVGKAVGKVNMLKLGHHGLAQSTTTQFIKAIMPDVCVQTANYAPVPEIAYDLTMIAQAPVFPTGKYNGIVLDIVEGGFIFYKDIH